MRTPARRALSGLTIEIAPLGFTDQRRAFVVLAKALGPALVELLAGARASAPEAQTETLRKTALEAIDRLSISALEEITEIFAPSSRAIFSSSDSAFLSEGSAQERAFGGANFGRYLEWLRFAVEVNFGPFFASFSAAAGALGREGSTPG